MAKLKTREVRSASSKIVLQLWLTTIKCLDTMLKAVELRLKTYWMDSWAPQANRFWSRSKLGSKIRRVGRKSRRIRARRPKTPPIETTNWSVVVRDRLWCSITSDRMLPWLLLLHSCSTSRRKLPQPQLFSSNQTQITCSSRNHRRTTRECSRGGNRAQSLKWCKEVGLSLR